jgi:hypothetical protein
MNNGWVKIHRKLLASIIFGNEKGLKVWIWCLLRANHKENTILRGRQRITIKEGQFIMGLIKASEEMDLAKTTIRYWLEFLQREGQVELKKTTKYTIVKVKNWTKYQEVEHKKNSNDTTNGTQKETNNNVKKEKNVKNIDTKVSMSVAPDNRNQDVEFIFDLFETFTGFRPKPIKAKNGFDLNRAAALRMVKKYGREDMAAMVEQVFAQMKKDRYFTSATNPLEFEEKLPKFKLRLDQLNSSTGVIKIL